MPAGEMAGQFKACAQFFEAAYNSVTAKIETNMALSMPGSFLTSGLAENDVKLRDTKTPTLIMHGTRDTRIHVDESERLFNKIPDSTPKAFVLVEGAEHGVGGEWGGIPEQGLTAYGDIMMDFLSDNAPECLVTE